VLSFPLRSWRHAVPVVGLQVEAMLVAQYSLLFVDFLVLGSLVALPLVVGELLLDRWFFWVSLMVP
jgi:hypothetical protein